MGQETQTLYSGTFERSMDAKKRVAVPATWLNKKEGEVFYVVPHPSREFLMVMPPAHFEEWEQRIQESNLSAEKKRKAIRQFYGAARSVNTDSQGRILLPEEHCSQVGLNGAATFVGSRSRFEIWNNERYARTAAEDEEIYKEVADEIGL